MSEDARQETVMYRIAGVFEYPHLVVLVGMLSGLALWYPIWNAFLRVPDVANPSQVHQMLSGASMALLLLGPMAGVLATVYTGKRALDYRKSMKEDAE